MAYLPPSGGDDNKLKSIITPILTFAAVIAFFASPLGGIFFAITNSLFLLALLTPLILVVGFQTWSAFNTVKGPCPSCSSEVVALNGGDPTLCLNCGAAVRATVDKKGIELCSGGGVDNFGQESGSIFDIFDTKVEDKEDKDKRLRRETTVIDVEVRKDDP
eukprot:CAMPEP_0172509750 /NCGR_PEP_ID=MMETSP1066-20121228/222766_1 /TAXON_ID=671091 /ORGANISM="Coscinodiscus wailesii, Strain CCMP2513" /LENGTH=160 /DNA_ID=CAMNT_0013288387 /DNA_START=324 /DNA_END=806 /DNA_ORIENTATION=-